MTGHSRVKTFCLLLLVIAEIRTVCPLVASEWMLSDEKRCQGCVDRIAGSGQAGVWPLYSRAWNVAEDVKEWLKAKLEFKFWNLSSHFLTGLDIGLGSNAAYRLYLTEIKSAMFEFNKIYLETFWSCFPFQNKAEIVLPPPEKSSIDKFINWMSPVIDLTNSVIANFKEKLSSILLETTGFKIGSLVSILILSIVNALVWNYFTEGEEVEEKLRQKSEFTDEELLEECLPDSDPEFRRMVYEWLTPTRGKLYTVENDDFVNTRDFAGGKPEEPSSLAAFKK